jgi:hypothetical protein
MTTIDKLNEFTFYKGWHGRGLSFDVGIGWTDLLYRFSCDVQELIDNGLESKDLTVVQVKSKFASLRVYTAGNQDAFDELLDKYVEEAERTCELCGDPGCVIVKKHWMYIVCEKCEKEL